MNIYIFGNGNTSFDDFLEHYAATLREYAGQKDVSFSLCDFRGVDTLAMEFLKTITANVRIYHIGERPRYLPDKYKTRVSQWEIIGGFADDESRDAAAIEGCTHFLAVDFNSNEKRKSGTQKNIERCMDSGKIRVRP